MADRDLDHFHSWLLQYRPIAGEKAPHMVRWVERFLRSQRGQHFADWRDAQRSFLTDLGESELQAWQIRQAGDAITLYCGQYCVRNETASLPSPNSTPPAAPSELLKEMARLLRLRHYAPRTERTYLGWARRFFQHRAPSPQTPTPEELKAYLSYLATDRRVASATQNQAFNALLFLFRHVIGTDVGDMGSSIRARRGPKLPVVLTLDETRAILGQLQGTMRLMLETLYGGGLRVSELVELRVKDIDLEPPALTVRGGKGDADRITLLPDRVVTDLRRHLQKVGRLHQRDLHAGLGRAPLPGALSRKYPGAATELGWQFVFPSSRLAMDEDHMVRRWHVSVASVQKAMKKAVRAAGVSKSASVHTLRHSF
ncbi:MAG: integron integrase, partial [Gemmatimonadetes bacterium]|nr:integron integrase [Gemmatimonadota bacterium]